MILAASGRPFSDRDTAEIKRAAMLAELGGTVALEVVPHPGGGYAIEQRVQEYPTPQSPVDELTEPVGQARGSGRTRYREQCGTPEVGQGAPSKVATVLKTAHLSPSLRAYPVKLVLVVIGLYSTIRPGSLLRWLHLPLPSSQQRSAGVLMLISVLAFCATVFALAQLMWTYAANSYVLDEQGILQIEWSFHGLLPRCRRTRIRYPQVRSVDVEQSLLQATFGVGHVRIGSGATDDYEIDLKNVGKPQSVQAEVERRVRLSHVA